VSYLLGGEAATRHGVRRGAYSTKGRAWHHRAGEDVCAARTSFVTIAGEPNPSPPLQHVEEQSFIERRGFCAYVASGSGLGYAVSRRRRDRAFRSTPSRVLAVVLPSAASARLWAGPFCSYSTSVEVCVARERARGPESRRSRTLSCFALFYTARHRQRCVRARFGRILAAMRFLRFSPRDGACFAGGLARCGGELPCLVLAMFRTRQQIFDVGCTGQIGKFTGQIPNHGFFLSPIHIAPVRRCLPAQNTLARTDT
jgi:hypothetical protein